MPIPKIPGVLTEPFQTIIGASPGVILGSDSREDAVNRLKASVEFAKEQSQANATQFAIDKALLLGDRFAPSLSYLARAAIGAQRYNNDLPPTDGPADPFGWYARGRRRNDPQLVIDWDIDMPRVGNYQLPSEYVEEIIPTFLEYQEYETFIAAKPEKFAGFASVNGFTLSLYEDIDLSSIAYINNWIRSIRNLDGTYNPPAEYQKTVVVYLTAYIGGRLTRIGQFDFLRCFPRSMAGIQMMSGSSERQRPQVEFSCSDVIFIPFTSTQASLVSNQGPLSVTTSPPSSAATAKEKFSFGDIWESVKNDGPIDTAKKYIPKEYQSLSGLKKIGLNAAADAVKGKAQSALPTRVRV